MNRFHCPPAVVAHVHNLLGPHVQRFARQLEDHWVWLLGANLLWNMQPARVVTWRLCVLDSSTCEAVDRLASTVPWESDCRPHRRYEDGVKKSVELHGCQEGPQPRVKIGYHR